MAQVHNEPGIYVEKQRHRHLGAALWAICLMSFVAGGIAATQLIYRNNYYVGWGLLAIDLLLIYFMVRKIAPIARAYVKHDQGRDGELMVAAILSNLPGEFHIFHGIKVGHGGDIDHLVVGPTGVFCLDTKNWFGTISVRGGKLTQNGSDYNKDHAGKFTARVMEFRTSIGNSAPYFRSVFVFPSADGHVPKWGDTGHVDCIRAPLLLDYIVNRGRNPDRLSDERVREMADLFGDLVKW